MDRIACSQLSPWPVVSTVRTCIGVNWRNITFDGDECCVPPGVDPDIWRLELPSILGAVLEPDDPQDDLPEADYLNVT